MFVRLDKELDARLGAAAKARGMTKNEVVRQALIRMLEDIEDVELADHALGIAKSRKSLSKVRKQFGIRR